MKKTAAILLALLWGHLLFAQPPSDTIFTHADQMPYFAGCAQTETPHEQQRRCSDQELVRFLSENLVYPEAAKEAGLQGTVYVSFVVDENGRVQSPTVLSDIGGGCGAAALAVLAKMPAWAPAQHAGHRVKVRLNLPIQFYLRSEDRDRAERFSLTWGGLQGQVTTLAQLKDALHHSVLVRGPEGDARFVDELEFRFEKKGRVVTAAGRGNIVPELEKVVERSKKGGTFTIWASVQDQGSFVSVSRSFQVVE